MAHRLLGALIACFWFCGNALAQTAGPVLPSQPTWEQLGLAQRTALSPLAAEWNALPDDRKLKWLGIADRFYKMTPDERARVQDRMRPWSSLSPEEREKARAQYKVLRNIPPEEKKLLEQKWQEYNALPEEQKERLKAKPRKRRPSKKTVKPSPPVPPVVVAAPVVRHPMPPKVIDLAPRMPHRPLYSSPPRVLR